MTLFCFIRHAHHDLLGRILVGRGSGVRLSGHGADQAARLAEALAETPFSVVLSSPQERTIETAAPIAARQGVALGVAEALDELDFGEWTGRSFEALQQDPAWRAFNRFRARVAAPGGERLIDVQRRLVAFLEGLREQHPETRVALVSHGDVIRAVLVHYLGMPLDFIQRLHVAPASVSLLELDAEGCRVLGVNLGLGASRLGTGE